MRLKGSIVKVQLIISRVNSEVLILVKKLLLKLSIMLRQGDFLCLFLSSVEYTQVVSISLA